MIQMRPGVKVKMWSPRFKNRPEVEPPGLLKAVGATSFLSVVGMLFYGVAVSISGSSSDSVGIEAAYVAVIHFILPLCAFYAISTNSPLSRIIVATYIVTLSSATIAGKGFLGELQIDETYKILVSAGILITVLSWLFGSPKMRFYFAAISNKPIPVDLVTRASELHGGNWLSPKAREKLAWFLGHMETIVLLGFIVAVIYAFVSTG
jgi:hypothetical protein